MKKITKILAALLVFCLAAGALVACTPKEDTTDNTTTTTTENNGTAYYFTVVYEDTQKPAEGVGVGLCETDGMCLMPVKTDADGKVSVDVTTLGGFGNYEIHLYNVPEGYEWDDSAERTNDATKEYTLVLKKKCEHIYVNEQCTLCGAYKTYTHTVSVCYDPDIADQTLAGKGIAGMSLMISDGSQIVAQGTTDENGDFSFEAKKYVAENEITSYKIYTSSGIPTGYTINESEPSFVANKYSTTIYVVDEVVKDPYTAFNPKKVNIGSTVHFNLTEQRFDDASLEDADPWSCTSYDDSLYYFSVKPKKKTDVGYYRITISGAPEGVEIFVGHYANSGSYVVGTPKASATGENPTLEFMMEEKYMKDSTGEWSYSNTWLFGLRVESEVEYPIEFDVTVEKVRDLIPGKDYVIKETIKPEVDPGAVKTEDVSGKKLYEISLVRDADGVLHVGNVNGPEAKAVLGSDGYYHLGTEDGPVLMLNLQNYNPIFGDGDSEVTFLTVNSLSGTENLLTSESKVVDGLSYTYTTYYSNMIKGYGELCNSDGVCKLNEQLYDFLTLWVKQRISGQHVEGYDDLAYMIALSYYA